ncbi:hypothetical protein ACTMTR_24490, partial [Klebsiella pneumoniae]
MDDSKLRYFASAWLISITLPADSAERYNAQFVNGIDPLAFNQFVASDGDVMPGTYDVNIYINDLLVDSRPVLMNPLMILVKIIKLRWIHILSYDQMVSRKINNQTTRCANSIF